MSSRNPLARASGLVALLLSLAHAPDASALDWDHADIKYGTEDPDRQFLNIYLADSDAPTPVCVFAHANGGSANDFGQRDADLVVGAGYSLVSWESLTSVGTPQQVAVGQADAELVYAWVRSNAATYNFDPDRIVVCGRSRGSVISWVVAHSGEPWVVGAYFFNALPDRVWMFTDSWDPMAELSERSPPMYLAFGPEPDDGDSHNPVNLYPVVDAYADLGLADDVELTHSMTRDGRIAFHFFPEFVAGLGSSAPVGEAPPASPGSDSGGGDGGGCHATGSPAGWALLFVGLLLARRRPPG